MPSTGNQNGDGYLVNGELFLWTGTEFENVGNIQGPQGEQGNDGQSAYDLWLDQPNTGTVNDFLASLKADETITALQLVSDDNGTPGDTSDDAIRLIYQDENGDSNNIDLSALNNSGTDDQAISYDPATNVVTLEDGGTKYFFC